MLAMAEDIGGQAFLDLVIELGVVFEKLVDVRLFEVKFLGVEGFDVIAAPLLGGGVIDLRLGDVPVLEHHGS